VIEPRYPVAETLSKLQKRFREGKFGLVARACDVRALAEMAKRLKIDPDRLFMIGVACSSDQAEACYCANPAPDIEQWADAVVIGEAVAGASPNPLVAEYENMSREERWAFLGEQFTKCIKCYGCRDICPVCFCDTCALENPFWVEPGVLVPEFPTYHLVKTMHMTNRCVDCRYCEVACPSSIPLTVIYDLIRMDITEPIGYEPGVDLSSVSPISARVDAVRCRSCGTCVDICEFSAPELVVEDNQRNAWIDPYNCTGCGTCSAHCPSGAITVGDSTDEKLSLALNAMLGEQVEGNGSISVVAITCYWKSFAGLKEADREYLTYHSTIHPLKVTCLGRINPGIILKAFESGADGVLLVGCPPGECHYQLENRHAEDLFVQAKDLVKLLGFGDQRLKLDTMAAGEEAKFTNVIRQFIDELNGNHDQ
jgi:coenzyme F420-reducing hydrogenase delta subunit/formate hydrogenlyase subunit 6/NADH:ubiquinone oxidoreductase subunit I